MLVLLFMIIIVQPTIKASPIIGRGFYVDGNNNVYYINIHHNDVGGNIQINLAGVTNNTITTSENADQSQIPSERDNYGGRRGHFGGGHVHFGGGHDHYGGGRGHFAGGHNHFRGVHDHFGGGHDHFGGGHDHFGGGHDHFGGGQGHFRGSQHGGRGNGFGFRTAPPSPEFPSLGGFRRSGPSGGFRQ